MFFVVAVCFDVLALAFKAIGVLAHTVAHTVKSYRRFCICCSCCCCWGRLQSVVFPCCLRCCISGLLFALLWPLLESDHSCILLVHATENHRISRALRSFGCSGSCSGLWSAALLVLLSLGYRFLLVSFFSLWFLCYCCYVMAVVVFCLALVGIFAIVVVALAILCWCRCTQKDETTRQRGSPENMTMSLSNNRPRQRGNFVSHVLVLCRAGS